MDDSKIIELFFERSEQAIIELSNKYGFICTKVADNILNNRQDSEECVNDTWLAAWNAMPDKRPERLNPFLAKITRNYLVMASLVSEDGSMSREDIADYIAGNIHSGDILLYHTTDADLQSLRALVPALYKKGYTFVTLNDMFGLPANETAPLTDDAGPEPLRPYIGMKETIG